MEPAKKKNPMETGESNGQTEPDPTTRDPERNPEPLEAREDIVEDLLGDFSEQTGASFG